MEAMLFHEERKRTQRLGTCKNLIQHLLKGKICTKRHQELPNRYVKGLITCPCWDTCRRVVEPIGTPEKHVKRSTSWKTCGWIPKMMVSKRMFLSIMGILGVYIGFSGWTYPLHMNLGWIMMIRQFINFLKEDIDNVPPNHSRSCDVTWHGHTSTWEEHISILTHRLHNALRALLRKKGHRKPASSMVGHGTYPKKLLSLRELIIPRRGNKHLSTKNKLDICWPTLTQRYLTIFLAISTIISLDLGLGILHPRKLT